MISILIFIFACFASASSVSFPTCPYPLPSRIEPCTCTVDDHYRMYLTCEFPQHFTSADLVAVVSQFDYNNNIYQFKISGFSKYYDTIREFTGQLDRNNVGRLNITNFIMEWVILNVNSSLIQDGAFEGSFGSIKTIDIYNSIRRKNVSMDIDLDKVLSHAGPTLESLQLSYVSNLRPSSFRTTPRLSKIKFMDAGFHHIPTNTFSGQYLPNLSSLEIYCYHGYGNMIMDNTTIQTDVFANLVNLTKLTISLQAIETIEKNAFNNLPNVEIIRISGTYINRIETSAFSNLPGVQFIFITWAKINRIETSAFNNLPNLQKIAFSGYINLIETSAFNNLPGVQSLDFSRTNINQIETSAFNNLPGAKSIAFSEISGIEEDSFVNFSSLKTFSLNSVLGMNVTYLPRFLSNSPLITEINIGYSNLENIAKDFFVGTPNVETIRLERNKKLEKIIIQDLSKLTAISLYESYPPNPLSIELRNLSKLETFRAGQQRIPSASFSEMQNLKEIDISDNILETISIDSTPNLELIDLSYNKLLNNTGLTTSLHGLLNTNIKLNLENTNIKNLDEITFRPLIERLNENSTSRGKIEMYNLNLDCGCDVKWLVVDIGRTDFFTRTKCPQRMRLDQVDPLLLKTMCPPEY